MDPVSAWRSHGGTQGTYMHQSITTGTAMTFSVLVPDHATGVRLPVLWYPSGLTCTHVNVAEKVEFRAACARHGIILVAPDTSPRGDTGRIMTALLYMQHGLQKLFKFPYAGLHPTPFQILTLGGIAGMQETFGGLSVLSGPFTRPVAFVPCGQMAVAYFLVHLGNNLGRLNGILPVVNGDDLAILFCFVFLYLFIAGTGAFSIDRRLSAKKGEKS